MRQSCWLWIKKLPISGRNIPHITGMESTSNIQHHSQWQDYPQKKSEILPTTKIKRSRRAINVIILIVIQLEVRASWAGTTKATSFELVWRGKDRKEGGSWAGKAYKELLWTSIGWHIELHGMLPNQLISGLRCFTVKSVLSRFMRFLCGEKL